MDWITEVKTLRAEGSFEKTMNFLNRLLKENPKDPQIFFQIAWTHDALGKESDAAPAYEKALELGLDGDDLEGAYVGLGSTYRCLGDYTNSKRVLEKGISLFPNNGALKIFYAMTLYNTENYHEAMEILLKEAAKSSHDPSIERYQRALLFYSQNLNKTFE